MIRCLAVDVLLWRAYASAGMFLPSRCLAMGLYVTAKMLIVYLLIFRLYEGGGKGKVCELCGYQASSELSFCSLGTGQGLCSVGLISA
jgi:hypothetical protein